MNNVVDGVYYCQQNRTEELNERIISRLNPNRLMQSQFSMRSVPTRYIRFPVIDSNNPSSEPIIRVPDYSVREDFNPGNDKSPYAGYANDIDKESNMKNLFYPFQRCAQSKHIPSSDSDLYKYNFVTNENIQQPFPNLFKEETFNEFNPNYCNIGKNVFYNSTKQQVKNLDDNPFMRSPTYTEEYRTARNITDKTMRGCEKSANKVEKMGKKEQTNIVLDIDEKNRN